MSQFYDQSSLVFLPSGYKDGKLYSQKPLSTSGELTFSRGSDIEATRVNSQGYIEKAKVNLSKNSQTMASWGSAGVTVDSTSQADPFGGTAAGRFSAAGGAVGYVFSDNTISYSSGNVYSGSYYVKDVDASYVQLTFATNPFGAGQYQNFDLTTGTKGTGAGLIDSTIEAVSGYAGWYRISITALCSSSATGGVVLVIVPSASATRLQNSNAGQTIDATGGQINYGLVAQDYVETTTAAVVTGITNDMPRLNYDPANPTCPSLLLEPSRTNGLPNSEYPLSWGVRSNISIETNNAISPEGVVNASNIYPTATGASFLYETLVYTSGTTYTYSVFAKANGKDYLQIATSGTSWASNVWCTFDLALGATDNNGFQSVGIEDYGNGWYRCYVVEPAVSTSSSRIVIGLVGSANAGRLSSVTADGTNGVLIYGVVSEAGSYPTSYIPTYGTSATRTAEVSNLLNMASGVASGATACTLFLEMEHTRENSAGDSFVFGQNNFTYPAGRGYIYSTGNGFADSFGGGGFTIPQSQTVKMIFRLNSLSNANIFQNGVKGTTVSGTAWAAIGSIQFRGAYASMKLKQILFFKSALTDAQCIELTTL